MRRTPLLLRRAWAAMLLATALFVAAASGRRHKSCIQPLLARYVPDTIPEPSGLSFSSTTRRLLANCDHCHYLTEMDELGGFTRYLRFSHTPAHKDIEAVAVDDALARIYIASEGSRIVSYFALDDYTEKKGELYLNELGAFHVDTPGTTDEQSGLEGMTALPNSNLMVANEKNPKLLLNISNSGQVHSVVQPKYLGDISGLAYDAALDLLWVLSDKSEAVFLTKLDGMTIVDRWDLPCKNPEGIAINNLHQPPLMYIVTDPSAPLKIPYVPLLFVFAKPQPGSGLSHNDAIIPSPYSAPCVGCRHVCDEIRKTGRHCELEVSPNDTLHVGETSDESASIPPLVLAATAMVVGLLFLIGCATLAALLYARYLRANAVSGSKGVVLSQEMDTAADDSEAPLVAERERGSLECEQLPGHVLQDDA